LIAGEGKHKTMDKETTIETKPEPKQTSYMDFVKKYKEACAKVAYWEYQKEQIVIDYINKDIIN
jgi:hypothetical protein